MTERVSKVSLKDGVVTANTTSHDENSERESSVRSALAPHADFYAALEALVPHVRRILGLPDNVWLGQIKVTGVSFSHSEKTDVEGAVIICQAVVPGADSPFCFNTPHLPFDHYSETGDGKIMPHDAIEDIEELRRETSKLLAGKSAQGDLFETDGKSAAAGDGRGDDDDRGEGTISVNGGPEVPMSVAKAALEVVTRGKRRRAREETH